MTLRYEVTPDGSDSREFDSKAAAVEYAQKFDRARLITWNVHRNLPNAKPDYVYKSCSMYTWSAVEARWSVWAIHGGPEQSWPCNPLED